MDRAWLYPLWRGEWDLTGEEVDREDTYRQAFDLQRITLDWEALRNPQHLQRAKLVVDYPDHSRSNVPCYSASHTQQHIASTLGLPVVGRIPAPHGEYRVSDTRASHPTAEQIRSGRLSLRTEVDRADGWAAVCGPQALRQIHGFQPITVFHPSTISVEVSYIREHAHHDQVPLRDRAARCGVIETGLGAVHRTSLLLSSISGDNDARLVYLGGDQAAVPGELCVCCFRRVIVARHTCPTVLEGLDREPRESEVVLNRAASIFRMVVRPTGHCLIPNAL